MAVAYRNLVDDFESARGAAAFLKVVAEEGGGGYRGALFLVNALGEPLEFTYSRVEIKQPLLWRSDGLRRNAARQLAAALFDACPRVPALLLCLAGEVDVELFTEDVEVSVKVARIAPEDALVGVTAAEERELAGSEAPLQLFWVGGAPAQESRERGLIDALARRGLLLEPFERAEVGIREVYGQVVGSRLG